MPIRLRLMADYCDWPIWGPRGGRLGEDDLPLSNALRDRIRAWFNAYFDSPRPDWPVWTAPEGVSDEDDERLYGEEAEAIAHAIQDELGPAYSVEFVP